MSKNMKFHRYLLVLLATLFWVGSVLADRYSEDEKRRMSNAWMTSSSSSYRAQEREREEREKKKKAVQYGIAIAVGAAYVGLDKLSKK